MAQCKIDGCEREVFNDKDKCALHVEKNEYSMDYQSGLLSEFYNQLVEYLLDYFWRNFNLPKRNFREFLKDTAAINLQQHQNLSAILKDISFPYHDSRDFFDYEKLLKKFGSIHFDACKFYTNDLELGNIKLFYQDCEFKKDWNLRSNPLLENYHNYQYQACKFNQEVYNDENKSPFGCGLFYLCDFQGKLKLRNKTVKRSLFRYAETEKYFNIPKVEIDNCVFEDKVFDPTSESVFSIKELVINKCRFEKDFILSNGQMDLFSCESSTFNDRLYFQNNRLKKLIIEKVSFNKPSDLTSTHFGEFLIKDSTFREYVYLNECELGTLELLEDTTKPARFVNVNFMSFINFRKAKFRSGLSIRDVNFNDAPNFLNVTIADQNTDRETYRIVKNSFDRIQNYIEANEFYQKEMMKWREELKLEKSKWWLRALLFLYAKFSNYGLDFIKPIKWIFILAGLYTLLIHSYEENWLYPSWSPFNSALNSIFTLMNTIAKNVIPFNRWVYGGIEALSLLFYLFFASLIWLVILAIKRNTKR